jgi:hypothetical protein
MWRNKEHILEYLPFEQSCLENIILFKSTVQRDGSGRYKAHSIVARRFFGKIRPPPILCGPFKVLERLLVF